MKDTIQFSIRVPKEVYNTFIEKGKTEKLSLNKLVNKAIINYIDSEKASSSFEAIIKELKSSSKIQNRTYNLLAQMFCNELFGANSPLYKDSCYQEFLKKEKNKYYE